MTCLQGSESTMPLTARRPITDERHHELPARDVAQPTETLAGGDSLLEAMRRMGARGAAPCRW